MAEEPGGSRLTIEIDREDGAAVVRCSGKLVAGVNDFLFEKVRGLIAESKRVTLDLTDLVQMDSMGLGTVVRLYVSARGTGCELVLVNVAPRILQVFRISHLLSFFTIVGETGIRT
jgi:anti-sigma B factor antagonist